MAKFSKVISAVWILAIPWLLFEIPWYIAAGKSYKQLQPNSDIFAKIVKNSRKYRQAINLVSVFLFLVELYQLLS